MAVLNRICKATSIARIALLAPIVALVSVRAASASAPVSWDDLLAPYSRGTSLPGGFRIDGVCADGKVWTFHELATDVPFGFFALE